MPYVLCTFLSILNKFYYMPKFSKQEIVCI